MIFDFNRDGNLSFGEELIGIGLLGALLEDCSATDAADDEDMDFITADNEALEEKLGVLREQLEELEDKLCDLQDREPGNPLSAAYNRWEERCNTLEEKILDLEYEIEELEAEMEI